MDAGTVGPRTTWGIGDYPRMARKLEPVSLDAVDRAGIGIGDRVVDVATGTGNAALLAAERGSRACGVDSEVALLAVASGRSRDTGHRAEWVAGDATALPLPNGAADVVVSVFGVMYAADHDAAARELARVAAPAARIVLASWAPGSFMPAMGGALGPYLPPPAPASGPPTRWGDEERLPALLAPHGLQVTGSSDRRVALDFADASAATDFLVDTAGHLVSERDRLTAEGRWDDIRQDLRQLVEAHAQPVPGGLALQLDYLVITAIRTS